MELLEKYRRMLREPDKTVLTIAEIGVNHAGSIETAEQLINVAVSAGVACVKFQKRTPELCVPDDQKDTMRDTPWGRMSYLEYRHAVEFEKKEYDEINRLCYDRISWFASAWDIPSVDFLERYNRCAFIKIPSALITNIPFLWRVRESNKRAILSTGASTPAMIDTAVEILGDRLAYLMHCTSTYPCATGELNLKCIQTLQEAYPGVKVGYSNHHPGLIYMPIAVAYGASAIEFHITLDRASWGTDQAASIEPAGVYRLVKYLRETEKAMGDGVKRIYDSEIPVMKKLRAA